MVKHLCTRFALSASLTISLAGATLAWSQQIDQPGTTTEQLEFLETGTIEIESSVPNPVLDSMADTALPSPVEETETLHHDQQSITPEILFRDLIASQPKAETSQDLPKPPVEPEVLPVRPRLEPTIVEQNTNAGMPQNQPHAYIDPALCKRLDHGFECENPSMLDLANQPCGRCNPCRSGSSSRVICDRIRQFTDRLHYIYERTLLGDARLFCERKFGSYVTTVLNAQIRAGQDEQMVLFKYDFEPSGSGSPTAKIKPTSLPRLYKIGEIMLTTGTPMIIEQSGNRELDKKRRIMVVNILASMGMATVPNSVISGRPGATGQSGFEAEIQYRSRVTQAVRNSQAPASSNGGNTSATAGAVVGGN